MFREVPRYDLGEPIKLRGGTYQLQKVGDWVRESSRANAKEEEAEAAAAAGRRLHDDIRIRFDPVPDG